MPTLLAQISDPHLRSDADAAAADAALARAVQAVLDLPNAVDAVIVTGDLADGGAPDEYARVQEALAALGDVPVRVLAGNHDEGPAFTAAFGPAAWDLHVGGLRVIGCDTTIAGHPEGTLDVDWLAARLREDPDTPTIVAMHHPPVATGLLALDAIGLPHDVRERLADLLRGTPNVRRVIAGHVHRTAFDTLGGCGVVTCAATFAQSRLDIGATEFAVTFDEPPALVLHVLLDSGELVSHAQPIPVGS